MGIFVRRVCQVVDGCLVHFKKYEGGYYSVAQIYVFICWSGKIYIFEPLVQCSFYYIDNEITRGSSVDKLQQLQPLDLKLLENINELKIQ